LEYARTISTIDDAVQFLEGGNDVGVRTGDAIRQRGHPEHGDPARWSHLALIGKEAQHIDSNEPREEASRTCDKSPLFAFLACSCLFDCLRLDTVGDLLRERLRLLVFPARTRRGTPLQPATENRLCRMVRRKAPPYLEFLDEDGELIFPSPTQLIRWTAADERANDLAWVISERKDRDE